MKTRLYVVGGVLLALSLTLTASAAQPQKSKPKIAVLNFDESGISNANAAVGKRISNYTIDKLVKSEVYSVVEREVIEKILREQNFGASGRVDPTTAAQIGKIVGADFIVYGTINKYHYSEPFTINILKKKGKGEVAVTVRIADAKTAIIVETFPAKGEVIKDKVELKGNNGSGGDDFRATVMDAATFDAANRVAAHLENWAGSSGAATPPTSGEPPRGAKVEPPKPASPNSSRSTPSATPPKSSSSSTASLPASPLPPATDKVGLVSQVSGNTVLIAVEQPGRVKVGDRLLIKRIGNAIPDPYNPGRYLGYDFTPIGSVTITAIVNERVVRGTFSGGGRKGRIAPTPKFQDWVVSAP